VIDSGLTVSDADNSALASATVAITSGFHAGEDALAFANDGSSMGNIAASYDSAAGVLSLTSVGATATLAQWQAALRAVTYTDTSDTPDTANRTISFQVSDGADASAAAARTLSVAAVNDAPVAHNGSAGGPPIVTGTLSASDDGPSLTYALVGQAAHGATTVNADGTFTYRANPGFTGADAFTFKANDGSLDSNVATQSLTVTPPTVVFAGGGQDDSFTAQPGSERIDAFGGNDTITFNFKLTEATISFVGNKVIVDGPNSHTELTGFEVYKFTDGTVNDNDGDPLVDDLYYYSHNHDVWDAHVDADAHYHQYGWHEERDPSAFFSTAFYLALNQDVKAAGIDPLGHFDQFGWKEGREPSPNFDASAYLARNPDVVKVGLDPLAHFLQYGAAEGRQPFALSLVASNGFDPVYYLQHNPDVLAAELDPKQHYDQFGWHEGRNPNAVFDTSGYLATYTDVQAAGVNPLDHYDQFGWHEGRDPSVNFDTTEYLSHYPDVAATGLNPLAHYLHYGQFEGRSAFPDGVWG
jgi:hypothetical protein